MYRFYYTLFVLIYKEKTFFFSCNLIMYIFVKEDNFLNYNFGKTHQPFLLVKYRQNIKTSE